MYTVLFQGLNAHFLCDGFHTLLLASGGHHSAELCSSMTTRPYWWSLILMIIRSNEQDGSRSSAHLGSQLWSTPNATLQARREAGAQRTLYAVACKRLLGTAFMQSP
jgi:hypothetical protein